MAEEGRIGSLCWGHIAQNRQYSCWGSEWLLLLTLSAAVKRSLQESAWMAWKAHRPIVLTRNVSGCTAGLAGQSIDGRGGKNRQAVMGADNVQQAMRLLGLSVTV
jgi:hypothetical protein